MLDFLRDSTFDQVMTLQQVEKNNTTQNLEQKAPIPANLKQNILQMGCIVSQGNSTAQQPCVFENKQSLIQGKVNPNAVTHLSKLAEEKNKQEIK